MCLLDNVGLRARVLEVHQMNTKIAGVFGGD
jgi:hypothetical protein